MSAIRQYFPNMMQTLHNLGYSLDYLEPNLTELDLFYDKSYPEQATVTFESATDWIYFKKTDSKKQLRERILTVKYLSRYLLSIGIDAYIPDIKVKGDFHKHPQLFNDMQLCRFFTGADRLKANKRSPNREYIAPVLFRIIYACGLRNSEACTMKKKDIDLKRGIVKAMHSKGGKDRIVFMDTTLTDLCNNLIPFILLYCQSGSTFFRFQGNGFTQRSIP